MVSVRLVNHATGAVDADPNFTLGTISVPAVPSSQWSAGSIFDERYVLRLPDQPGAYDLYVGLYDPQVDQLLPAADNTQPIEGDHVRLTGISAGVISLSADQADHPLAVWGAALHLEHAACQTAGGQTDLSLDWLLVERPPDAMTLFAHLWNGDTLVGQQDAPPLDAAALDAVPPGGTFNTHWQIAAASPPDSVQIGLYDHTTQRWRVAAGQLAISDNLLTIACGDG